MNSRAPGRAVIASAFALVVAACSGSGDAVIGADPTVAEAPSSTDPSGSAPATDATDDRSTTSDPPKVTVPPVDPGPSSEPPATDATDQPTLFEAPTGDYTILFPGPPDRTDLPIPLPDRQIVADAYVYENPAAAYFTSVIDYPPGYFPADGTTDTTAVLEGARDGAVTNVDGELLTSAPTALDGVPGIAFTFTADSAFPGAVGSALVFFAEPRLYQSFALGLPSQADRFQAFVDSFAFTVDITVPVGSGAGTTVDAFSFVSPAGDYVLDFPAEPSSEPLDVNRPGGVVTTELFFSEDASAAFFTASFDDPSDGGVTEPSAVLEGVRDGAVADGELLSSEPFELEGVPGIFFTFRVPDPTGDGLGVSAVLFDDPRLYQTFALGDPEREADLRAFVESFRFVIEGET